MITTLDNKQWTKEELLPKMYDDTFYYGYLGQNALSSSSIKTLIKSPKTYYYTTKYGSSSESPALIAGRIFHTLLLEPEKRDDLTIVDVATRNTKAFKLALSENDPQTVYTTKELNTADKLVDQLLRNDEAAYYLNDCLFEQPEAMMIQDLPFRGKADILRFDSIVDIKTTTDISKFKWSADKYGYDLQAYLYCKMFNKDKFTFVVIDKASCDIGIYDCSEEFLERGKLKLQAGIDLYKYFFQTEGVDLDQYVTRATL